MGVERADFSLRVTIHQCGKSGRAFNQALTGRPACYSTLLCLWPRNSRTARSVQQKPRGNTAHWLMRALTQLSFFYSPGPPAQGMGPPMVDWSPLWQLTTKTVLHRQATGQSDLGSSSGEIILWHDICVVTSWPFELTRILLKNQAIHEQVLTHFSFKVIQNMFPYHSGNNFKIKLYWWVLCGCLWVCATSWEGGTGGGQKRVSEPPEQELQAVVRSLVWLLGNELRSSGRTVSSPLWNHFYSPQIKL